MEGPRRVYVGPKNELPYDFGRRVIPSVTVHSPAFNRRTKIDTELYKSFLPDFREKSQRNFAMHFLASGEPVILDTWDPSVRESRPFWNPSEKYKETIKSGAVNIEASFNLEEGTDFYRFLFAIAHNKLDLNTSLAFAVENWDPDAADRNIFQQPWLINRYRKFYSVDAGYNLFEHFEPIEHADMLGILGRDLESQIPQAVRDIVYNHLVGRYVQLATAQDRSPLIEGELRSLIIDGDLPPSGFSSLDITKRKPEYYVDLYKRTRELDCTDLVRMNLESTRFGIDQNTRISPLLIHPSF